METLTCGVLNFESYEVPQGSLEEALQINYSDTKDHTEDVFLSRFAFYAPLSGSIEDILARRPDIQPSTVPLNADTNAKQTPGGLSLSGGPKNGPKWTEVVTLGKIDSQPVNGIDLDELVRGQISAAEEGQDDDHDSNPTLATDRWGFLIDKSGGGSSLAAMSSSSSSQSSKQRAKESAGEKKWVQILQQWDSYSEERKKKKRQRLRKGIPNTLRAEIWKKLLCTADLRGKDPDMYPRLLKEESRYAGQIQLDIHRTLPHHIYYKESGGFGQTRLFNVLKAYSNYDKHVGYCQGMGFITAFLLLYVPEEDAFYLLVKLLRDYELVGLFEPGFHGLYKAFFIHEQLFDLFLPRLSSHFKTQGIAASMYCTKWYMEIFISSLPFPFVIRVWDLLFCEGTAVLYKVSLAILKLLQKELLKLPFEEILRRLQDLGKWLCATITPDDLINACSEFNLPSKRLVKLTKEYEASVAHQA
eukprot:TRINITY_DN1033_c0_g1_i1.p1 TRINITY_DN1033_c0_g1~~TRINITY_DN1033_c0_g1_i1.p1  ORF type:complete len:472 (-),score=162.47 TRINITY_DN1033_c0_g1_i1:19-1434(-)